MNPDFLNSNLRRTSLEEEKTFVEECCGDERAIRCYRVETIRAAIASSAGRSFATLGNGDHNDKIEIENLPFTWSIGDAAWVFTGPFYEIQLKSTCSRDDAHLWLKSFFHAERQASTLHSQKLTHIVGMPQVSNRAIASARGSRISWFNIANQDRLLAAALADTTKDSPHPIAITRMIHHEVAHTFEPMMKDWLQTLATDVPHANLNLIAQDLNPQYLPDRIEAWAEKRLNNPLKTGTLDEELAAEFLVEAYAQLIMEKRPWTPGLWPTLDSLSEPMKTRLLTPLPSAKTAHIPLEIPERIMHVPKTIIVSAPVARKR